MSDFGGRSGIFHQWQNIRLHGDKHVCTEVPQHEVPTCRAEEREFSVGALQPNRVLHDAVWVSTVFQAEGVT